jgi:hypothetical protein
MLDALIEKNRKTVKTTHQIVKENSSPGSSAT